MTHKRESSKVLMSRQKKKELASKSQIKVEIYDARTHILQGTSRTSSIKPSRIMKQIDTNAALYSTSHCIMFVQCLSKSPINKFPPTTTKNSFKTIFVCQQQSSFFSIINKKKGMRNHPMQLSGGE